MQDVPLLRPTEAAKILCVSVDTLARMRVEGRGPRYVKLGTERTAVVRYQRAELDRYIDSCVQQSTSGKGG